MLSMSQVLFPLIIFPYISRILEPEGIGLVTFAENICRYGILFASLGIPIYGIREIAKINGNQKKLECLFYELVILNGVFTLLVLSIYFFFIYNVDKFIIKEAS